MGKSPYFPLVKILFVTSVSFSWPLNTPKKGSTLRGKNLLPKEHILSFQSTPLLHEKAKTKNSRVASSKSLTNHLNYFITYRPNIIEIYTNIQLLVSIKIYKIYIAEAAIGVYFDGVLILFLRLECRASAQGA